MKNRRLAAGRRAGRSITSLPPGSPVGAGSPAHHKIGRKTSKYDRHPKDFYTEEPWVSRRLFEELSFRGAICDPAAGSGNIVRSAQVAGYRVQSSDIRRGRDFLKSRAARDNIVSNPPFSIIGEFTRHAHRVVREGGLVCLLWQTRRINAARWLRDLDLYRILYLTPRPWVAPQSAIRAGKRGGEQDYCWIILKKGQPGYTVDWLTREKQ